MVCTIVAGFCAELTADLTESGAAEGLAALTDGVFAVDAALLLAGAGVASFDFEESGRVGLPVADFADCLGGACDEVLECDCGLPFTPAGFPDTAFSGLASNLLFIDIRPTPLPTIAPATTAETRAAQVALTCTRPAA